MSKTTDLLICPELAPKVFSGDKTATRRTSGFDDINLVPDDFRLSYVGTDHNEQWGASLEQRSPEHFYWFVACPYGQPGDLLRFLTTWAVDPKYDQVKPLDLPRHVSVWTAFEPKAPLPRQGIGKKRAGRFMPLWMRKRLPVYELAGVGVERVQQIQLCDLEAEGFPPNNEQGWDTTEPFRLLWDRLNGEGSWAANPWNWVLRFQRVQAERMVASA